MHFFFATAECYRPNAELGNVGEISWDLGPTLAGWMEEADPTAYRGFVDGEAGRNGMAQPFHHAILPLASAADRATEVRWGLRDFELRFGRRPSGVWMPETATDLPTLRLLADEGISHTIVAPWQVVAAGDPRRPARIDLGDGRSILAVRYDGILSTAVSFEPTATVDADWFVQDRVIPRLHEIDQFGMEMEGGGPPLLLVASDGELYGHHQPGREHFLARLVGATAPEGRPFDTPSLEEALAHASATEVVAGVLVERTSWSCPHGITRWAAACGCVADGSWKAPLRGAFERLAGGIDSVTDHLIRALPGGPDPWALRDAWVDVVLGRREAADLIRERTGLSDPADVAATTDAMDAQRWRLAMFASCTWFWESPARVETAGALRAATHAARIVDALAGTDLERRLRHDLRSIEVEGTDGERLLRAALQVVGAPVEAAGRPENPSARGLRATG